MFVVCTLLDYLCFIFEQLFDAQLYSAILDDHGLSLTAWLMFVIVGVFAMRVDFFACTCVGTYSYLMRRIDRWLHR